MSNKHLVRTALLGAGICFAHAPSKGESNNGLQTLKAMMFFNGNCQMQIIEGFFPCKGAVMRGEYTTGRASITFYKENTSFSMSGAGDRQPNLGNYFQSIDRIRIMDGETVKAEIPMEGECHFSLGIEREEISMNWTAPVVTEVCAGMEVTAYLSAEM